MRALRHDPQAVVAVSVLAPRTTTASSAPSCLDVRGDAVFIPATHAAIQSEHRRLMHASHLSAFTDGNCGSSSSDDGREEHKSLAATRTTPAAITYSHAPLRGRLLHTEGAGANAASRSAIDGPASIDSALCDPLAEAMLRAVRSGPRSVSVLVASGARGTGKTPLVMKVLEAVVVAALQARDVEVRIGAAVVWPQGGAEAAGDLVTCRAFPHPQPPADDSAPALLRGQQFAACATASEARQVLASCHGRCDVRPDEAGDLETCKEPSRRQRTLLPFGRGHVWWSVCFRFGGGVDPSSPGRVAVLHVLDPLGPSVGNFHHSEDTHYAAESSAAVRAILHDVSTASAASGSAANVSVSSSVSHSRVQAARARLLVPRRLRDLVDDDGAVSASLFLLACVRRDGLFDYNTRRELSTALRLEGLNARRPPTAAPQTDPITFPDAAFLAADVAALGPSPKDMSDEASPPTDRRQMDDSRDDAPPSPVAGDGYSDDWDASSAASSHRIAALQKERDTLTAALVDAAAGSGASGRSGSARLKGSSRQSSGPPSRHSSWREQLAAAVQEVKGAVPPHIAAAPANPTTAAPVPADDRDAVAPAATRRHAKEPSHPPAAFPDVSVPFDHNDTPSSSPAAAGSGAGAAALQEALARVTADYRRVLGQQSTLLQEVADVVVGPLVAYFEGERAVREAAYRKGAVENSRLLDSLLSASRHDATVNASTASVLAAALPARHPPPHAPSPLDHITAYRDMGGRTVTASDTFRRVLNAAGEHYRLAKRDLQQALARNEGLAVDLHGALEERDALRRQVAALTTRLQAADGAAASQSRSLLHSDGVAQQEDKSQRTALAAIFGRAPGASDAPMVVAEGDADVEGPGGHSSEAAGALTLLEGRIAALLQDVERCAAKVSPSSSGALPGPCLRDRLDEHAPQVAKAVAACRRAIIDAAQRERQYLNIVVGSGPAASRGTQPPPQPLPPRPAERSYAEQSARRKPPPAAWRR